MAFYSMAQDSPLLWALTCALPCKWPKFNNNPLFAICDIVAASFATLQIWTRKVSWKHDLFTIVFSCPGPQRSRQMAYQYTIAPWCFSLHASPVENLCQPFLLYSWFYFLFNFTTGQFYIKLSLSLSHSPLSFFSLSLFAHTDILFKSKFAT